MRTDEGMIKVSVRFILWLFHFVIVPIFFIASMLEPLIRLFEAVIQNKKITEEETSVMYRVLYYKRIIDKRKVRLGLLPEDFEQKEQKEPRGIKRFLWIIHRAFAIPLYYFIAFTSIYIYIFVYPYLR